MYEYLTPQNVELSDIYDKPELITSLLYKKLIQKLDAALMLIPQRRYFEANRAIQYCHDIITRLGFGLKYEAGVLADQLESLYRYMFDRLREANFKKDEAILREVRRITRELDSAWTIAMQQVYSGKEGHAAVRNSENNSNRPPVITKRPSHRVNPYQQREIDQEVYQYEQESQEIHIKK